MGDGVIGIGDRRHAGRHQMKRFPPERSLQAIRDMALDFPLQVDRMPARRAIKIHCCFDGGRAGLRAPDDFGQRNQMWRAGRMAEHDPLRIATGRLHATHQQTR